MSTRWFCVCVLILMCPAGTYGQAYVFQAADYSYLHSPWFQIDGCNYETGCEFTFDGVLGVHLGANDSLKFVTADLELSGNEELVDHPSLEYAPITGSLLAELLQDWDLTLASDDGETKTFEWQRGSFELSVNQKSLRLHGGYDFRPSDGDGVFFDATGRRTWIGDSNLDLRFDSGDLVHVFSAGLYEDEIGDNATWSTGDWNGDKEFDSADLVAAFQDGGYDQGHRKVLNPVPEPTSLVMLVMGFVVAAYVVRC